MSSPPQKGFACRRFLNMHRLLTLIFAGLPLLLVPPAAMRAQDTDTSCTHLGEVIKALPPSAQLRLRTPGEHWSGRLLAARHTDSLTLAGNPGRRSVALAEIDTLWVRREGHQALLAGAGFGTLMFFLLQIGSGGDRHSATRLGAIVFLGSVGGGMLIDGASHRWVQRYPR
jgi:hypothetical protein